MNSKEDVLAFLKEKQIVHSHRTNVNKGKMNNRDACALFLAHVGPTKLRDIRDFLMTWRFGEVTYTRSVQYSYHGRCPKEKLSNLKPKMGFSYMFNSCSFGGYGCVARDAYQQGNWMNGNHTLRNEPREKDAGTFFRRTYWFRSAPSVYSPTIECMKRVKEIL